MVQIKNYLITLVENEPVCPYLIWSAAELAVATTPYRFGVESTTNKTMDTRTGEWFIQYGEKAAYAAADGVEESIRQVAGALLPKDLFYGWSAIHPAIEDEKFYWPSGYDEKKIIL